MTVFRRILRYLILWGVLFLILCVISVVRYWDKVAAILSTTFSSYLTLLIAGGVIIGLLIWAFRRLLRF